jgi:hypothetical protein
MASGADYNNAEALPGNRKRALILLSFSGPKKEEIMTLQDKLDAYKAGFVKKVPPETLAIMHRATEELQNSGIVDRVIKVGDPVPDFALPNMHGTMVASAELLRQGPLVITFYRGVW